MSEEPFLLVSLEEDKAKKLAQVLSNDTARKILDVLSKIEHATESEVAKKLGLPLSTVHYNMQHLVKSDLVNGDDYSYSKKGKEIIHYSLSNKYVIIAPKKTEALAEKLKRFLPVVAIMALVTYTIRFIRRPAEITPEPEMLRIASDTIEMAKTGAPIQTANQEFYLWFLFGSAAALLVYFVWADIIYKKLKKQ